MSGDAEKLNPKIRTVVVGIKEPREIILYPLSVAGQFRMTDLITEAINGVLAVKLEEADNPMVWIGTIVTTLQKNAAEILSVATCKECDGEQLLDDVDNDQFIEIMETVFEVNYAGAVEKLPLLMERWKPLFVKEKKDTPSKRPSPTSSNGTPDTPSGTSTSEISSKAV